MQEIVKVATIDVNTGNLVCITEMSKDEYIWEFDTYDEEYYGYRSYLVAEDGSLTLA